MDDPFFGNHRWYQQPAPTRYPFSRSPSFVYDVDPTREARRPEKKPGPRVVPVQFVGVDRSGCALKIQKVFRGFLVRKCMKKMKDIKVEVDKIEERVLKGEVEELIRRDEKERLRMNESLMSLLFKLDSICGLDFGVRACRKAVIRKVIALQERIDAIVVLPPNPIDDDDLDGNRENDPPPQSVVDQEAAGDLEDCVDIVDVGVDCEVKVSESNCVKDGVDDSIGERVREKERKGKDDIDNKRNGELLERMMEDNEKMVSLMTQLFERNETQMRMLNALTHRVELLEKAFVCDKLRKNKEMKKKKKKTKTTKEKVCDAAAMRTED
ncbi:hypothetical protein BUALT_Bualt17G0014000 [Buddleja alternifolia]|uniref:BAG domain-containing protein n=1 Tax=Buddleja alternifolia TaxID=168488 RepID=A0AAV6WG12_9LAMI|nr:hypothetical protein BUALT_Bualt17G0014000 [Buddleja alternifolia]